MDMIYCGVETAKIKTILSKLIANNHINNIKKIEPQNKRYE